MPTKPAKPTKPKCKYAKLTVPQLKRRATILFNNFIRDRDFANNCISCEVNAVEQAGHFYAATKHPALRFNVDNVHGQCCKCNYFLHGNLIKYRINLETKIGLTKLKELDKMADQKVGRKQREMLINIIETYAAYGVRKT